MFSMQIGVPEAKAILQQCWEGADCNPFLYIAPVSILVCTTHCQCPLTIAGAQKEGHHSQRLQQYLMEAMYICRWYELVRRFPPS